MVSLAPELAKQGAEQKARARAALALVGEKTANASIRERAARAAAALQ